MVIESEYGIGPGQIKLERTLPVTLRGDASNLVPAGRLRVQSIMVFEKYISLKARQSVTEETSSGRKHQSQGAEELWDLRVSIVDENENLEPYLPVLASVSVDYIGENSVAGRHVTVTAGKAAETLRRREVPRPAAQ